MKIINFKFVVHHVLAAWFIVHAFTTLALLYDIDLVEDFIRDGEMFLSTSDFDYERMSYFLLTASLSRFVGLLVAVIISLIFAIKTKVHWLNCIVVLVGGYLLVEFDALGWNYLKIMFLSPGKVTENVLAKLLINSAVYLIIAATILWITPILRNIKRLVIQKNSKP